MAHLRLLIDEDISKGPLLAATLRQRGFDAIAVQEPGKMGMPDADHRRTPMLTLGLSARLPAIS